MSALRNLEGPPSPLDMENVARELMWDGKFAPVVTIAHAMVDWWGARTEKEMPRTRVEFHFSWWLGMQSGAHAAYHGSEQRRSDRRLARLRRAR